MQTKPDISLAMWWRAGVTGMVSYLDAAAIVTTSIALVIYLREWGNTALIGPLSGLLTLMIAVGAVVGGRLGDRYGRKTIFTLTMLIYIIGSAILVLAGGMPAIWCGIIILGFAVGADLPVSLAMIAEEAPDGARAKLLQFSHMLWILGIATTAALGAMFGHLGLSGGRWLYGHILLVSIAVLLARLTLSESKEWLRARELERTRPAAAAAGIIASGAWKNLFRLPWLAAMVATGLFYSLANISANTNGQFATYIYTEIIGVSVSLASGLNLLNTCICFTFVLLFMRVVDGENRFRWFLFAAALQVTGPLMVVIFGVQLPAMLTMLILCSIGGALAGEPMYKIWSQELFPTLLRSSAQGMTIAFTRVVAAVVALFTPQILSSGPRNLYIFIFIVMSAAMLIGIFWVARLPKASVLQSRSAQSDPSLTHQERKDHVTN